MKKDVWPWLIARRNDWAESQPSKVEGFPDILYFQQQRSTTQYPNDIAFKNGV
jgi:hypothetical protein